MKSLILNRANEDEFIPFSREFPVGMLPIANKPILEHQIELLAQKNHNDIKICMHHLPFVVENYFKTGQRWGVNITYHLAKTGLKNTADIHGLQKFITEETLILPDDIFCDLDIDDIVRAHRSKNSLVTVVLSSLQQQCYYGKFYRGWLSDRLFSPVDGADKVEEFYNLGVYIFSPEIFDHMDGADMEKTLENFILSEKLLNTERVHGYLSDVSWQRIGSLGSYIMANNLVLDKKMKMAIVSAKERQDGVWVGRNCNIASDAKLRPPVIIGANTMIGKDAEIGPYAVIGENVVVHDGVTIKDSLVFSYSYVGEMTEVEEKIINKHCLVDIPTGTNTYVNDYFILGSLKENFHQKTIARIINLFFGGVLFLIASPVLAGYYLLNKLVFKGKLIRSEKVVRPNGSATSKENYFTIFEIESAFCFIRRLPQLISVLKGEMNLVGNSPVKVELFEKYQEEWLRQKFSVPAGVISLVDTVRDKNISEEERIIIENTYAVKRTIRVDLLIMLRVLKLIKKVPV